MEFNSFIQSKKVVWTIVIILGAAVLAGVFGLGIFVGYHKAKFSYDWSEQYNQNFGGPRRGIIGRSEPGPNFPEAHGIAGPIIKIDDNSLVIKGLKNIEMVVNVNSQTTIRNSNQSIKMIDLKVGDNVVVIGEPNTSGQIDASFIRILPFPFVNPPIPTPTQ